MRIYKDNSVDKHRPLRVLLIMEQCNPEWPSVPLLGFNIFRELNQKVDVTLCTHGRNQTNLEKTNIKAKILYFQESFWSRYYYRLISPIINFRGGIWPLNHAMAYPIYAEFNRNVFFRLKDQVLENKYDVVHAMTPIIPRYPVRIIEVCKTTPFILGPVNGGLPFPNGFEEVARKEFSGLNILRLLCHLIPGYKKTYQLADRILSGSSYTLMMIKKMFDLSDDKIQLYFENGLTESFFIDEKDIKKSNTPLILLFVGRLVPFKGADMLIEAIANLNPDIKQKVLLKIVGDGSERKNLEELVKQKNLSSKIIFKGWVKNEKISEVYKEADVFCYPSIREFGGAVVLEAMAAGLPCIVVNNGGIGEYVTESSGLKILPKSRTFIVQELVQAITKLVEEPELRYSMGRGAFERAKQFKWSRKVDDLINIYEEVISRKMMSQRP